MLAHRRAGSCTIQPIPCPRTCRHDAKHQHHRFRWDRPVEGNWIMIVLGTDRLGHARRNRTTSIPVGRRSDDRLKTASPCSAPDSADVRGRFLCRSTSRPRHTTGKPAQRLAGRPGGHQGARACPLRVAPCGQVEEDGTPLERVAGLLAWGGAGLPCAAGRAYRCQEYCHCPSEERVC